MTIFTDHFKIPEGVKIISFDVFDTLLLRPFEKPTDVFNFMQPYVETMIGEKINFRKLRKQAERDIRQKAFPVEEVTIDEIYNNFKEIPLKYRGAIKFLEIETELQLCFKRKSAEILYNKAKEMGFTVIAISDIYFEAPLLQKLLLKNGIECDHVFSSATLKKRKKTGNIFPLILNKLGVVGAEVLHIGDNPISDIEKAQLYGINTFCLPLLRSEFYKNSHYKRLFKGKKEDLLTSASISLMCEKLDNQTQKPDVKSLFDGNMYNIGFNAFGSIMFAFTNWVYKMAIENDIKTIFFVARDGFIMQKIMQILHPEAPFKCEYFESSRRSLEVLNISSKEDVIQTFSKGYRNTSIGKFIDEKLECDPSKIASIITKFGFKTLGENIKGIYHSKAEKLKLKSVIEFYSDEILTRTLKEKEFAMKFIQKSGILAEEKIAICDVGYSGTTQKILSKFRENIFGFYLITNWKAGEVKNTFGFLGNKMPIFKFKRLKDAIRLMETIIFSAPFGTVKNYDKNGNPVLANLEPFEENRLEANAYTWKGMIDFAILVKKRFAKEVENLNFTPANISKMFLDFALTPTKNDANLMQGVTFENKSNAGGNNPILSSKVWKAGYFAYKYPILSKPIYFVWRKILKGLKILG